MTFREAVRNTWGKILLTLLPFVLTGAIALIRTQERVRQLEVASPQHVTRVEIQGRLDDILRELAALHEDVREIRRNGK